MTKIEVYEYMTLQKILAIALVSVLIFSGFGIAVSSSRGSTMKTDGSAELSFAGGNGTESDPYQISNVTQLQNMNQDLDAHYELISDIDALETSGWSGFSPVGNDSHKFNGSLDGQGHEISGLYIDRPDTYDVGLFGETGSGASIDDVGLVNVDVSGKGHVGGLVGVNYGRVQMSYATGNVNGEMNIGGLIGYNDGRVKKSYSTCDTQGVLARVGGLVGDNDGFLSNSYATGNVIATGDTEYPVDTISIGGLVGSNDGAVSDSYATGAVTGDNEVGGLVGANQNDGTIIRSYAIGKLTTGGEEVGGLVGYNNGTVSNSFWDVNATGQSSGSGGTGKTTAEMKDIDTFTDESTQGLNDAWDFVGHPNDDKGDKDIWEIYENETKNDGYPFFYREEIEKFNLDINIEGNGTVKVDGEEVQDGWTGEFREDTDLTLRAIGEDHQEFHNWEGDIPEDIEERKEINITMDSNKTVTATFEEKSVEDDGKGFPGFTSTLLVLAMVTSIAIYRKKR